MRDVSAVLELLPPYLAIVTIYRTQFRNAYLVRLPVTSECIVDVRTIAIDTPIPDVQVTLDSIRRK